MLAWSEGIAGRQKTRNHGYDVIVGELYWLLRSLRACHAKPKLKSTGAGRYRLLSRWWDAYRKAASLSEKSGRCGITSRLRSVALYLWLIVVISVGQSIRCSNIWKLLPGAGYNVRFEHKADSQVQFKEAGGTVREIDVWAESPWLSPLWLSSSSACRWAGNHYRDNAITYKAQRDKNAEELKLANAAITDMQMRQRDVAALDAKYTKELSLMQSWKWCSAYWWCRRWSSSVASKRPVDQCVKPATASGVDNTASPTGRHRWTGIISPSRRGWSLCKKQLEGTQVY